MPDVALRKDFGGLVPVAGPESLLPTMRLLVLFSLLCILLLCFSSFSTEGKKHPVKHGKGRPCCPKSRNLDVAIPRGHHVRSCKPCKPRQGNSIWIVPGALPRQM
ncbi:protein GPR15LG [Tamandua tetradactyla]|uniref:protein GPR15LG n=1 Tax=Tamandua tetradactyla TaxID=48850 RepID=UPI004053E46B